MKKHMNLKKNVTILLYFVFFSFCLFKGGPNYAEENNQISTTGFTYSIKLPDNQIDKELGYFKLKMNPGQKQKLMITLSNPNDEKVTVEVKLNGAKSNQNGVIEYGDSTIDDDQSLKFKFKDIVKSPDFVELGPGETKDLEISLNMPEIEYDGVIAGGIQLMRTGQTEESKDNTGSKIINQYAYVVGMVLQENDNLVEPKLSLNDVNAGQNNYRNAIFINFSNVMPAYLNNMTVEVQITEKGKKTVLYERKQTAMRMAPNSFINFPINMNGERMVPGDYEAKILVTSGVKKWTWEKEFKITDEDADKFNERDVGLVQEKEINWQFIFLLAMILIIIIILLYYLLSKIRIKKIRKKQKKISKNKRKK